MGKQSPIRLILASSSPDRRDLLTRAGYQFEVMPSHIEEPKGEGFSTARSLVQHIAWLKAAAVAPRIDAGLILAADTLGWLDGQPLGKPADAADARRILNFLSGREHELWTGVCLWRRPDDWQVAWQEVSKVAMRPMNDPEMEAYLLSKRWEGCSGAYAIQEREDDFVRVVTGSTTNVIGLPMETLAEVLRRLNV